MAIKPEQNNGDAYTEGSGAPNEPHSDAIYSGESVPADQKNEPANEAVGDTSWTKICPKCSVANEGLGEYCPHCGASYARGRKLKFSRKAIIITLAVLLALGAVTGITLGVQHSQQVEAEEAADRAAQAAAAAAEKEQERQAEAKAESENGQRALRALIVEGLQEAVQKDAVKRVDEGSLDGPIMRTECTPLGGGSIDDLTAITGTFECIAVNEKRDDGTESGYIFSATVNWDAASYSWRLGR
ncbi:hypothetical protein [Arthrobacter sunyaminii]|uniref:Uncharacterized protein n=1 Tax=Arthrobacter sunyaminii TaxID=2816859 RepID=A0A975XL86_9MICC|nr:hypothetical protein [Arthrobacter sunyaminii]MBO0907769.1 hypothetical protein [Arthrobacter sunyaminii]QWQ36831.1 hypothetical protein KG104_03255 [Arthrobacter sunyaminii]